MVSDKLEGGGGAVQGSFTEEGFWLSSERWKEFLAVEVEGPSSPKEGGTPLGVSAIPRPFHGTFFQEWLPKEFVERISQLDTKSPVTKINGKRHTDSRAVFF